MCLLSTAISEKQTIISILTGKRVRTKREITGEDGYPDVPIFMSTFREMGSVVEQHNRDLAAWERQVRRKQKPAQKEQAKPPELRRVLKRLRQLRAEGKQRNQPRQRTKSFDRDSR